MGLEWRVNSPYTQKPLQEWDSDITYPLFDYSSLLVGPRRFQSIVLGSSANWVSPGAYGALSCLSLLRCFCPLPPPSLGDGPLALWRGWRQIKPSMSRPTR
jgi:hypothetical protein